MNRCNGYIFGPGTVPKRVDLLRDLQRYAYSSHIRTGFDIGANVGQFGLAVTMDPPGAQLMSFEPVETTFKELIRNFSSFPNAKTFRFALGAKEGEL